MRSSPRRLADPVSAPSVDVLHLEDDDDYAELVRLWIAGRGLTIHRVRSRKELFDYLAVYAPSPRCLLLDVALKDSKGLTLCDELKESPAFQQLPIVLLSGSNLTVCECQQHGALQIVRKGAEGEPELLAALTAVIAQHDRSRGILICGDLRLTPQNRSASIAGKVSVQLRPRPFDALLLLVKSTPNKVTDLELYAEFMERSSYNLNDEPELTVKLVVKNYVSRLRRMLGPALGSRIVRFRNEGYVYLPPGQDSKGIF